MSQQFKNIQYQNSPASAVYPNYHRCFHYNRHNNGLIPFHNRAARVNVMAGSERTMRTGKIMGNLNEFTSNRSTNYMKDWRGDNTNILKEDTQPAGFVKQFIDPILMIFDTKSNLNPTNSVDGKFRDIDARIVNYAYDAPNIGENTIVTRKNTPLHYFHDIVFQRTDDNDPKKAKLSLLRYGNDLIDQRPIEPPGIRNALHKYINQITVDSDMYTKSSHMEMRSHVFRFVNNYTVDKDPIQKMIRQNIVRS